MPDIPDFNFTDLDVDKLIETANAQIEKMDELQREMADVVGVARDEDRLVTAEYTTEGLHELELSPKALRLSAAVLAKRIKETVREAADDLQNQLSDLMGKAYGDEDNPMRFVKDPEGALKNVKNAEAAFDRTYEDVMGSLENIRRRLDDL